MAYYCFKTEQFEEDTRGQSVNIEDAINGPEDQYDSCTPDPMGANCDWGEIEGRYLKKRRGTPGGEYRIVLIKIRCKDQFLSDLRKQYRSDLNSIDDCYCYVGVRYFSAGNRDYRRLDWHSNNIGNDFQSFLKLTTRERWQELFDSAKNFMVEKIVNDIELNESLAPTYITGNELDFLHQTQETTYSQLEHACYESIKWVNKVSEFSNWFELQKKLANLYDQSEDELTELRSAGEGNAYIDRIQPELIPLDSKNEIYAVLYRFYQVEDNKIFFYLLDWGAREYATRVAETWKGKCESASWNLSTKEGQRELLRTCRRAYPIWTMYLDADFWCENIEKSENSNYDLSDEEVEILSRNNVSFPLFIDGRAGSGKSTVLQYLFCAYLLKVLSFNSSNNDEEIKPVIYLTYNKKLVESALKLISDLLRNNAQLRDFQSEHALDRETINRQIERLTGSDSVIREFNSVVKDLIKKGNPGKELEFDEEHYVSYAKFRNFWRREIGANHEVARRYNPEFCWHVIRTHIKGWSIDSFLNPSEYANLGDSERTVSIADFEFIYEKVWPWYRNKLEEERLWDDQDLVRYCLRPEDETDPRKQKEGYAIPSFSGVFCDESQDFTRIELELIFRISMFSTRRYHSKEFELLPFVFVGDEYQTINPTGFSWTVLRSNFAKFFEKLIDGNMASSPKPFALTKNFRSTRPIVRFANRIQLLRKALFKKEAFNLEPQSAYFADPADPVLGLTQEDPAVWRFLKERSAVLIVPDSLDIHEDVILKEHVGFNDDKLPQGITIVTPSQVKGLEYSDVALYGFGSCLTPETILNNLQNGLDSAERIERQYFLNNVYVAVTRARENLYIIDPIFSENDKENNSFWQFCYEGSGTCGNKMFSTCQDSMLHELQTGDIDKWSKSLGEIELRSPDQLRNKASLTLKERRAKCSQEEANAKQQRDPYLMRNAAKRWLELDGQSGGENETRCLAYALEFEYEWFDAGITFLQTNNSRDGACRCLWRACGTSKRKEAMEKLASLDEREGGLPRRCASLYLDRHPNPGKVSELISQLKATLIGSQNVSLSELVRDTKSIWSSVLNELLTRVDFNLEDANQLTQLGNLLSNCNELCDNGVSIKPSLRAEWRYLKGDKAGAVRLWEQDRSNSDLLQNEHYLDAKACTVPFPNNLEFLARLERWEIIEQNYRDQRPELTTRTQMVNVVTSFIKVGEDYEETKDLLCKCITKTDNLEEALRLVDSFKTRWNGRVSDEGVNFVKALLYYKDDKIENCSRVILDSLKDKYDYAHNLIEVIKNTENREYMENFRSTLEKKESRSVFNKFQAYEDNVFIQLIFYAFGRSLEENYNIRRIDVLSFYEFAEQWKSISDFKSEIQRRWIYVKEEQARTSSDSASAVQEAQRKRAELGIALSEEIPSLFIFDRWKSVFQQAFEGIKNISSPAAYEVHDNNATSGAFNKNMLYTICQESGYTVRFNPVDFKLIVKYESDYEDLNGWFDARKGEFDHAFVLKKDGRICHEGSGRRTPFRLCWTSDELQLYVNNEECKHLPRYDS